MGSGATPSFSGNAKQLIKVYSKYLPTILRSTAEQQPYIDELLSGSAKNILDKYGQPMAEAGQRLQASNAAAASGTVGDILRGSGGQNVAEASRQYSQLNPEFASAKSAADQLVKSISLTGLSPGEANAVERSLNQTNTGTGNLGLINPTNVVSNAMAFGDRMTQKRQELAGAINTANSLQGTEQGAINTMLNGALTTPSSSTATNFGMASLPVNGSQAFTGGQNLLGSLTSSQNVLDPLWQQHAFQGSAQGYAHSFGENVNCCFIFLEIYNGELPWYVRVERDNYYRSDPRLPIGYKKMAKWLVPLMRRFKSIRRIVNYTMVKPLSWFGGWKWNVNKWGFLGWPFKQFWFMIWRYL